MLSSLIDSGISQNVVGSLQPDGIFCIIGGMFLCSFHKVEEIVCPYLTQAEVEKRAVLSDDVQKEIIWMRHGYKDRFFADPFLLHENSEIYTIIAEEYFLWEQKGRIVKLKIDKSTKQLMDRDVLIDAPYHLSFPFIWKNRIYPEASKSGSLKAYSVDGEERETIADMGLVDAVIVEDGKKWIFSTRIFDKKDDACRRLLRYELGENNVVINETEVTIKSSFHNSRMAGSFFSVEGRLYRPAQNSTETIYGESVSINEVVLNDDKGYSEKLVKRIDSHGSRRFNRGLHTFNVYDYVTIVDGFEMQYHPFYKLIAKIRQQFSYRKDNKKNE